MHHRKTAIEFFVSLLEMAYQRHSWHGSNLKGSIRRVGAAQAAWQPGPHRRSIWEITLHTAYWKYAVRRRLLGEKRGSFALKGSNWFPLPADRGDKSWRGVTALLNKEHAALVEAVASLTVRDLSRKAPGSRLTNSFVITGAAYHDIYHAGQIQLLKRLFASA
jgi:uncharacterized damage-inducible protein DinB